MVRKSFLLSVEPRKMVQEPSVKRFFGKTRLVLLEIYSKEPLLVPVFKKVPLTTFSPHTNLLVSFLFLNQVGVKGSFRVP